MAQTAITQPHRDERPTIEHPSWCDPGSCHIDTNGTGRHQSPTLQLPPIPPNPLTITVRLSQGATIPGHPLSDIPLVYAALSDDEDEICDAAMYPHMARELARILTHTANLTEQ